MIGAPEIDGNIVFGVDAWQCSVCESAHQNMVDATKCCARTKASAITSSAVDVAADRARIKVLEDALRRLVECAEGLIIETGVCCCGDYVEGHSYLSGHSPVDAGSYYWSKAVAGAHTALGPKP